jgi:hypothetical protein
MSSATGIPDVNGDDAANTYSNEEEPLLGRAGDVSQQQNQTLLNNVWIGTAVLAQAGIWILFGIVWGAILSDDVMFFSVHPVSSKRRSVFLGKQNYLRVSANEVSLYCSLRM